MSRDPLMTHNELMAAPHNRFFEWWGNANKSICSLVWEHEQALEPLLQLENNDNRTQDRLLMNQLANLKSKKVHLDHLKKRWLSHHPEDRGYE